MAPFLPNDLLHHAATIRQKSLSNGLREHFPHGLSHIPEPQNYVVITQ